MSQFVSEFVGRAIYLDTMMPYALLRGIDPAAKAFFARIERGEIIAHTSVLTFDELAYRLLLALIRDRYSGSPLDRLRTEESKLIAEFAPAVTTQLSLLQSFPNINVVDVTVADLDVMNSVIAKYHVRPRDALHFAAMQRLECFDLASNDHHFDQIPDVRRFAL